jgi:hypothetical protein
MPGKNVVKAAGGGDGAGLGEGHGELLTATPA